MSRIKAIRVSCSGEIAKSAKVQEFSTYNLLDTHDVFAKGENSLFSSCIGIALLVLKMRPSMLRYEPLPRTGRARTLHGYSYKETDDFYPNPNASTLMGGNADSQTQYSDSVGSVLIARADKKPLEMNHLHVILRLLAEATEKASAGQMDEAMDMLTPAYFRDYYPSNALFFKGQLADGEWSDRSPWDDDQQATAEHAEDRGQAGDDEEDEVL